MVDTKPEIKIEPNSKEALEAHIQKGIKLYKEGKYQEVDQQLRNMELAKRLGFAFEKFGRTAIIHHPVKDELMTRRIIELLASNSFFFPAHGSARARLQVTSVAFSPRSAKDSKPEYVQRIYQNLALLGLEEWIHGLQHVKGGPVAGHQDSEVDVALYLKDRGVELTPIFLGQHERRKALTRMGRK